MSSLADDTIIKITHLPEKWSQFLGTQAETGMGFQDVEITLTNGQKVDGLVLNGSTLETLVTVNDRDIASIRVKSGREVKRWKGDDGKAMSRG